MPPSPALLAQLRRVTLALVCILCAHAPLHATQDAITGLVGVGTWATQAEFKDIRVTQGERVLFESDFSKGLEGWTTRRGQWSVVDGALRQTSLDEDARALIGDPSWSNYTLSFKARKIAGAEGFLALFGMPSTQDPEKSFWNIGGWGNTAHALQSAGLPENRRRGQVETGRWHDIRVELAGNTVRTFLDGALIQTGARPSDKDAQRVFPHALIPDLIADPNIIEFDGVFYCYATTDGMGRGLATSGLPVVWQSRDFVNWSFSGSIFPENFNAKYWAPSVPVKKDGRYYLFPTLDNLISVVVADAPTGPFRTLDGRDIYPGSGWTPFPLGTEHPIDAEIFRDDDGQDYMLISRRRIATLKPDFSGLASRVTEIRTKRSGYSEGPAMFKRRGIYYYLYTLGASESYQYAYMMSRVSPLGPWEGPAQDIISTTDKAQGIYGPGHGCFFNPQGTDRWFFVYLEYGRSSTNRQVLAAEMFFNPDGTLQPIKLEPKATYALRVDPAYAKPNLALAATATASSHQPERRIPPIADQTLNRIETFGPANAHDGSNGSRWMASPDDSQPWFQLDLGRVRRVERTELYFVTPTLGHTYQLEASTDGRRWRTVGGSTQPRIQSPHTDADIGRARYLRVTLLSGAPGLWEFRAY